MDFHAPDLQDIFLVHCITGHGTAVAKSLEHPLENAGFSKRAKAFLVFRASSFEWRPSAMVDAMERGDWILLPNADQCPAAILDRLNPLLEWPAVKLCSGSYLFGSSK
jgi:midasin (ATPase involved in ribosome maturation)